MLADAGSTRTNVPVQRWSLGTVVVAALSATAIGGGLLFADSITALPNVAVYAGSTAAAVLAMVLLARHSRHGMWSIPSVYLLVFCIFHFGMTGVLALGLPISEDMLTIMSLYWPAQGAVRHATLSATLGVASYALGVLAVGRTKRPPVSEEPVAETAEDVVIARGGLVLLAGGIGAWFVGVLSAAGPTVLVASYGVFLETTRASNLSGLYFTLGLGLVMVASAQTMRFKRVAYFLFGGWALVALPLGLRGEVLFATAAALAMTAMRRPLFSWRKALIGGVALLSVIAAIRVVRQVGIGGSVATLDFAPQNALAEMGGSIWPVAEVISWTSSGEDFLYGESYWAPIDRALYHVLPGWSRPEADDDDRLSNVVVLKRVGAIGFSPIAEAYRNFGDLGVVVFMLLLGLLLGRMECWGNSPPLRVVAGIILFPLIIFIRNDFTPVPAEVATGLAYYWAVRLLARRKWARLRIR